MHIVIDGRGLDSTTQGYGRNLLKNLEKIDKQNHYTVLTLPEDKIWRPTKNSFEIKKVDIPHYSLKEQLALRSELKKLKPDLVHFLMPQQPLLYFGKRVTTIHDLTLVYYQNLDKNKIIYTIEQTIFKFLLKNVARRSDFVITPTQYVKNDLAQYVPLDQEKIVVTLESCDPIEESTQPVGALEGKDFIFTVSNAFPYKNLNCLIDAFSDLKKSYPDLQLGLAGKKSFFYDQLESYVEDKGIKDVHFLGFVSEGQKRWLYESALAYINPSKSEGFGLQALEAMTYKTPMVLSNSTTLPEVAGDTALYFDPENISELVKQLKLVLNKDPSVIKLVDRYQRQLSLYSWQKMARETLDTYKQVLGQ